MSARSVRDTVLSDYARNLIKHKARRLARRSDLRDLDEEDISQELLLWLVSRAERFDLTRASLNTFTARVVESAIATLLRDRNRQKRRGDQFTGALDAPAGAENGATLLRNLLTKADTARRSGVDAPDENPEDREVVELVRQAVAALPAHLAPICMRLMSGLRPAAIARDLNISRRQVRNAAEEIRRHLEAFGLDHV